MEEMKVAPDIAPMFLWMDVERREGNVSTKPQRDIQEMWGRAVGFTWLQVH